jgi:hypothetical protein
MPAQVGNDDAVSGREAIEDGRKHRAGDHQTVHQQQRRPGSALGVVENHRSCHLSLPRLESP